MVYGPKGRTNFWTLISHLFMERLNHIDVAKGILILMVVFHHMPQVYVKFLDANNAFLTEIDEWNWLYSTFFMPAFFILSGFCSNFDIDIKSFVLKNFKSLIFAGIMLSIVESFVNSTLNFSFVYSVNLKHQVKTFLIHGTHYWFLTALFVDKICYFFMAKFHFSDVIKGIICLVSMGIAVEIFSITGSNDSNNYWFYCHSLFYLIFVCIGNLIRKYNLFEDKFLLLGYVYIVLVVLFCVANHYPPVATHYIGLHSYKEIPESLILAVTGTLLIIQIAKRIARHFPKENVLSYFGKLSLIIYTLHIGVLRNVEYLVSSYIVIPDGYAETISFLFITLFIAMIVILVVSRLLKTRQLEWITGKW